MHLLSTLVLADSSGGSSFDWMLRAIGVAAIIWAFFKGLHSLLVKPPAPAGSPVPTPVAPAARSAAPVSDELTAEIIAIITAAVAVTTDSTRRIVAITSPNSHWEKAGRQSVLTSHRIR